MNDFETPQNELERAIVAVASAGEDPDASARRTVLVTLVQTNVTVLLPRRDETGQPPEDVKPLFVSDGADTKQAMLAAFTSRARAEAFRGDESAAEAQEIAGTQLLLGVPEGAGVILNPNQVHGYRISPELATVLRKDIQATLERLRNDAGSSGDDIA